MEKIDLPKSKGAQKITELVNEWVNKWINEWIIRWIKRQQKYKWISEKKKERLRKIERTNERKKTEKNKENTVKKEWHKRHSIGQKDEREIIAATTNKFYKHTNRMEIKIPEVFTDFGRRSSFLDTPALTFNLARADCREDLFLIMASFRAPPHCKPAPNRKSYTNTRA